MGIFKSKTGVSDGLRLYVLSSNSCMKWELEVHGIEGL